MMIVQRTALEDRDQICLLFNIVIILSLIRAKLGWILLYPIMRNWILCVGVLNCDTNSLYMQHLSKKPLQGPEEFPLQGIQKKHEAYIVFHIMNNQFLISDPGLPCPLPTAMKLWQTCKQEKSQTLLSSSDVFRRYTNSKCMDTQSKHNHIRKTQKQNINRSSEFFLGSLYKVTTILTSNTVDQLYFSCNSYKWNHPGYILGVAILQLKIAFYICF